MYLFCQTFYLSFLVAYTKRETQAVVVSIRYKQVNCLERQLSSYSNKQIFIFWTLKGNIIGGKWQANTTTVINTVLGFVTLRLAEKAQDHFKKSLFPSGKMGGIPKEEKWNKFR